MFGFGKPKCPVDPVIKGWMEYRLNWLADRFGHDRLFEMQVVTPTNDFFPFALDGSEEAAEQTFGLVRRYMGIEPKQVHFEIYDEENPPDLGVPHEYETDRTAGFYEDSIYKRVGVERSQLRDPTSFIATLAHELGHVHLLGSGLLDHAEEDHEPLTDLITVYFGMGIFGANAALHERQWQQGLWHGHSSRKMGYLDFPKWGYAHALIAHARAEDKPAWAKHLRPDVRKFFNDGLKYLKATGDTKFKG